jgi:phosphoglycolate phosphatase
MTIPPTIVLDLDGTLVDSAPDLAGTLNDVLIAEGLDPLPYDTVRNLVGRGVRVLLERGFEASGKTPEAAEMERLFPAFVDRYAGRIAELSRPFPGVLEALDRFDAAGWRVAVCTNKLEGLALKLLDALDLTRRFHAIGGGDTFGAAKPDPRALLGTIARAGGNPAKAVMVGDSATDIDAARAIAIPVVAVDFGYTAVPVRELQPDRAISHFGELWDAVQAVLPTGIA